MTPGKRVLDLAIMLLLLPILLPLGLLIALAILVLDGAPVFYVSERMSAPDRAFRLWKFRTMTAVSGAATATGGDKQARITRLGRILRRGHGDEIPQAWNVLRGDLSIVGPRPPLPSYVRRFPAVYSEVLQCRPGLTGLASVFYSRHEARILKDCETPEETDALYARRCIPRKARLDLIYRDNRSLRLDLWLMWITIARIFGLWSRRRR